MKSVKNCCILKEHEDVYYKLLYDLKNCVTQHFYYQTKNSFLQLIEKQGKASKKPLIDTLNFCDNIKYRCATTFPKSLHRVPQSSLAEAVQASMKAAHENNIS